MSNSKSVNSYAVALTLTLVLRLIVGRRFYAGKVGTGILSL